MSQAFSLDLITLDPDLQPRASIDNELVREYADALAAGAQFPRVTVFFDGATYWLADGYHRWHAHKVAGVEEIAATIRQNSKQEALRFSLAANADHGRRREPGDYQKAYEIACRNGLVEPHVTEEVQDVLKCSIRWARDLTKQAREAKDHERDEAIRAERARGLTQREVAKRIGVSQAQVSKVELEHKRQTAVCVQPASPPQPRSTIVPGAAAPPLAAAATSTPEPDPPPRPMFNPDAFKAAAAEHKDAGNVLWNDLIDALERLAHVSSVQALADHPRPKLIAQAMPLARAAVDTLATIIADVEAADAEAA